MERLHRLVGSGDRIALTMVPFVVAAVVLQMVAPDISSVGGPPVWLGVVSIIVLVPGLVIWAWSAILILTEVPRGHLITRGPYAWVKHPLYTAVALLVLPWVGFLLDTWIGAVLGLVLYGAMRRFAPAEEADLARTFGPAWTEYVRRVRLGWI